MTREKRHRFYPPILARARDMRHPLTPAEAKVWARVRNRQLGYKIRRQHVIGRFIPDFYCADARLVIEIDGDIHAAPDQAEYDAARTRWLEEEGYRVIRFHNEDVHRNLESVLAAIVAACDSHSPHRGEGRGEGQVSATNAGRLDSAGRREGQVSATDAGHSDSAGRGEGRIP